MQNGWFAGCDRRLAGPTIHRNSDRGASPYNDAMSDSVATYDQRYLAGVLFFNQQDYFEAHEVWEAIWQESAGPERRFIQALIQAAVALHHFRNGNLRGAIKLYRSSKDYMDRYGSHYLGLDTSDFWRQMERCCRGVLQPTEGVPAAVFDEQLVPRIALEPAPEVWPDPEDYLEEDEI